MSFRKLTPVPSKSRKSEPRKPARKNVKKHSKDYSKRTNR
jgi:hypothetical protein